MGRHYMSSAGQVATANRNAHMYVYTCTEVTLLSAWQVYVYTHFLIAPAIFRMCVYPYACVCARACVRVREKERERVCVCVCQQPHSMTQRNLLSRCAISCTDELPQKWIGSSTNSGSHLSRTHRASMMCARISCVEQRWTSHRMSRTQWVIFHELIELYVTNSQGADDMGTYQLRQATLNRALQWASGPSLDDDKGQYVCVSMYIYTHVYIYVSLCIYTCMYKYMHAHVCRVSICIHIYVYIYICISMYIYTNIHLYEYVHICTFIHLYEFVSIDV